MFTSFTTGAAQRLHHNGCIVHFCSLAASRATNTKRPAANVARAKIGVLCVCVCVWLVLPTWTEWNCHHLRAADSQLWPMNPIWNHLNLYDLPPNEGWVTTISHFKNGWFFRSEHPRWWAMGRHPVKGPKRESVGAPQQLSYSTKESVAKCVVFTGSQRAHVATLRSLLDLWDLSFA